MRQLVMKATEVGEIIEIVSATLAQGPNVMHVQIPIRIASFTTLIYVRAPPLSSTKECMFHLGRQRPPPISPWLVGSIALD
jgi:hypothetical protein